MCISLEYSRATLNGLDGTFQMLKWKGRKYHHAFYVMDPLA